MDKDSNIIYFDTGLTYRKPNGKTAKVRQKRRHIVRERTPGKYEHKFEFIGYVGE